MKISKRTLLGILFIILSLFYFLGRKIWHPYYSFLRGYQTTEDIIAHTKYQNNSLPLSSITRITLIGLKHEKKLEVWICKADQTWRRYKTYRFTGFSGRLGPKLKEGDLQIPEGLYSIEYLNPNSSYHLSLKINYPNDFDKKMASQSSRTNIGSNIFIHGGSLTIGCIPIGDEAIEELFQLVATVGKNNVDVILSPYDMRRKKQVRLPSSPIWTKQLYKMIQQKLIHFYD